MGYTQIQHLQRDGCAHCTKKNDKREISNYRPITLLNTDYKIYTKALATKLAEVAHKVIHPNQAGFMPGRSIFEQVKLARMMVHYAEATEEGLLWHWTRKKHMIKYRTATSGGH